MKANASDLAEPFFFFIYRGGSRAAATPSWMLQQP